MQHSPSLDHILQTGLGFWASKTLLSAVELGVFSQLAEGPLSLEELTRRVGIHSRGARDFFDALVALHFLEREGDYYRNTPDTDIFLDRAKPSYAGGILEMANGRLYPFWGSLTEGLRTGQPQNEAKNGEQVFEKLYADPKRLELFLGGMTGISLGTGRAIANAFPWSDYKTFADIGCAQGALPVQVALRHPHLTGRGYDLPVVGPIFEQYVKANAVADRLSFQGGNFFEDPLPEVDVLVMGHILHDWNLEKKRFLLAKAYDALPAGRCSKSC
ncbi:MAG: methyltransferase, partial [Verrucomicrobiaceae bacterium]